MTSTGRSACMKVGGFQVSFLLGGGKGGGGLVAGFIVGDGWGGVGGDSGVANEGEGWDQSAPVLQQRIQLLMFAWQVWRDEHQKQYSWDQQEGVLGIKIMIET